MPDNLAPDNLAPDNSMPSPVPTPRSEPMHTPKRRYTRLTADLREKLLDALSIWPNMLAAVKTIGVSQSTLGAHLRKDAKFRLKCDEALIAGRFSILCAVTEYCLLGPLPKGEEAGPIERDEDGIPIINPRTMDVNTAKWLLSYHAKAVETREKARAAERAAKEKQTKEAEKAVEKAAAALAKAEKEKGADADAASVLTPLPSDEETDAVLAEVIAKFDAAAKQRRHEARLRGQEKRDANRAAAQAKAVQKRRAAKKR